jgi:hypothetical protein
MSYHIRHTVQSQADIERLYAWIVGRSGRPAAQRWYGSYTRALERLRTMPLSCGLAHENPRFTVELRHFLFGIHPKRRYRALSPGLLWHPETSPPLPPARLTRLNLVM